jgi:hypothetical protein
MNSDKKRYFLTSEFCLASTLLCFGVILDSIQKTDSTKVIFVFKRNKDLNPIINNFWSRTLKIEPNAFWEATRFLKSRIYEGRS